MTGEAQFFSDSIPEPTGGGKWSSNFYSAEFDYIDLELFDIRDNIRSHQRYVQADGWMYHAFLDIRGKKCIEFLKAEPDNKWRQTIPFRYDWMKNAQLMRKPIEVKANFLNDARAART